jgi:glycosyltransferase involved in cell wall biosynthesis
MGWQGEKNSDQMYSILVATTSFPRWEGDYRGTFIWQGCRALAGLGARVRVVAPHAAGARTHEEISGVEIFRPRYLIPEQWEALLDTPGGLPVLWEHGGGKRWSILPFLFSHAAAIARLARGFDLIHAHWTLSAFAAQLGSGIHRRPLVCTVQGSDIYRAMRLPIAGGLARTALRSARKVIALSAALADAAAAEGVDRNRIGIIPNGVDAKLFAPNGIPREPVLLFAGSLIRRKGVATLIEALALIRRRHPLCRLVVIGDGPLRPELESLAATNGTADAVRFTGSLAPEEVARWMRRSELFVLPSLEEAQGVVLLEALASGTPCIASNIGGIPEVLRPEWGTLVPPGDSFALANAALDLLAEAGRRRAMGLAAAAGVRERYDWPVIARKIMNVYAEALGAPVP